MSTDNTHSTDDITGVADSDVTSAPSKSTPLATIWRQGLWSNNAGLVQLLGLCPLLAVTNNAINGLALGLATIATLVVSNVSVSISRQWLVPSIRIPFYMLVIASNVTIIDLLLNAYFYSIHQVLGIFIPLIVTNCAIIGRAEAFAAKNNPVPALHDGMATGLGFALILFTLGALREIIGAGTFMSQAHILFGDFGHAMSIQLSNNYAGFLPAILPPGAFITMGLLIALKNIIDAKQDKSRSTIQ